MKDGLLSPTKLRPMSLLSETETEAPGALITERKNGGEGREPV